MRIEPISDGAAGDEIAAFLAGRGVGDDAARAWLPGAVCALRDGDGTVTGVSLVSAANVPDVGGRRFWLYRAIAPGEDRAALLPATYDALAERFDADDAEAPVGLALVLDPADLGERPEAEWPGPPRVIHASVLTDGRHLRIAYFPGASIIPGRPPGPSSGWDLESGAPIVVFAEQGEIGARDVVDFWVRESAMPAPVAEQRVSEVLLVAVSDGAVGGVCTAYLRHSDEVGMPMWHVRAFVGAAERRHATGLRFLLTARDTLERRFADGSDLRGRGVLIEVEHEGLKQFAPESTWMPSDFTFVGENLRGDHVRVHWFPGARVV